MSDLKDFSFDNVEDLAPQGNPPTGVYEVTLNMAVEPAKEDAAAQLRLNFAITAIRSQSPDADTASEAVVGQEFAAWLSLDTKIGEGKTASRAAGTKRILQPLLGLFSVSNPLELCQAINDTPLVLHAKWSKPVISAGKPPKRFFNLEKLELL